jgi:adenosine kinase
LNANKDTVYVPGGSTQNALRIAAWLLQRPHTCVYMGCIGDDVYGRILADKAKDAGVDTYFQVNAAQKTGTCAVLVYKQNR